jgi:hypothetical protein
MSQNEVSGVSARVQFDPGEVDPLSRWQRIGGGVAGTALAGAGAVATFVSENGAGSAVALVVGGFFLLMAITGMPFLGGRLMDAELVMGRRRARLIQRARAALWVAAASFQDDLKSLAEHVQSETDKPVGIVDWSARKAGLRRGIDDLAIRSAQSPPSPPSPQSPRVPGQSASPSTGSASSAQA